jgi:hypothetical protein
MLRCFCFFTLLLTLSQSSRDIYVYHLIDYEHGTQQTSTELCSTSISPINCHWFANESIKNLHDLKESHTASTSYTILRNTTSTVAVYNMHTLWSRTRSHIPQDCKLVSDLNMVESLESHVNYRKMYDAAEPHFHG